MKNKFFDKWKNTGVHSVKFIDNKIITVFSGKWNTAIGLAKFLLKNKKVFR